jgi:hypothetical protein
MEKNKTEEAFKFKKFIDSLERAMTDFMNSRRKGHKIVSKIQIYDHRIAVFIIGFNVGYGGKSLTYEAVMIKSEIEGLPDDFHGEIRMPNPQSISPETRFMSSTLNCSDIVEDILPTPLSKYYEDKILSHMRDLVEKFFGKINKSGNDWETIIATPFTAYKLSA